MRNEIRERISTRKQELSMAETNFSHDQVQELLRQQAEMFKGVISELKKPNPLEERKLREELEKEQRRKLAMIALGKAEEFARTNRQKSCTHSRDDKGNYVNKGQGTWTTGGNVGTNGIGSLVCWRCAKTWRWRASAAEREYSENVGLLGFVPPSEDICLTQCVYCSKDFENKELKAHEAACSMKPAPVIV